MNFEGYENFTIANFIYTNVGFTFTNEQETSVFLVDSRSGTASGGGEITTVSPYFAMVSSSANHLIVESAQPLVEIGAFFGGGMFISEFYYQRMSIFGANRQCTMGCLPQRRSIHRLAKQCSILHCSFRSF